MAKTCGKSALVSLICVFSSVLAFAAPDVSSVTPNPASLGATVTISGTGFGATQEASTVALNGITAEVSIWSDTSIALIVPEGANSGKLVVTVDGGESNAVGITICRGMHKNRLPGN